MAELEFDNLKFEKKEDSIRVNFLRLFYFDMPIEELKREFRKAGSIEAKDNNLYLENISQNKAERKFNTILSKNFSKLKNKLTGNKTIYIHQNSNIPLIGHIAFGIVDRNTSLIEIKPITSCNLDCIYCSVDQSKRPVDFVIEEEYLIKEFRKLVGYKGIDCIEAHIGTQGEPFLYDDMLKLIQDLKAIPQVKTISIDTNGTLLNKEKIDKLADAGLTRFNLSIDALSPELAEKMAGTGYDISNIKKIASYISRKAELMITPLWVPGINDKEIPKLIEFARSLGCRIGIQNFLNYKFGKNPAKQMEWGDFYSKIKELEKKHGTRLILDEKDFNIIKTKPLPKPFKRNQFIEAEIVLPGRLKDEKLAVKDNRIISVPNCRLPLHKKAKLKIKRTKHNIFTAFLLD
ncbi:radical SAM protein [Candidatus Woesearchaeota archaeon]|nr:radical SAM protein [Candidatus Woesearchaeota archaeon]